MVSKVNKMTSLPDSYTPEEALGLIERIATTQPQNAKALTVSVSMVSSWNTLNPPKSYELIQQLQQEQYPSANTLLATLYSRGVLDEPDQYRAITILEGEAKKDTHLPSMLLQVFTIKVEQSAEIKPKLMLMYY